VSNGAGFINRPTPSNRAVEMTGGGKPGKPNAGFPSFPPPLEIASRFPHSHSFDDDYTHSKGQTTTSPMIWQPYFTNSFPWLWSWLKTTIKSKRDR
jgi:hypothetical protein